MFKSNLIIPEGYSSSMDLRETEKAIRFIKSRFQDRLAEELNLVRVSAPILVLRKTGINDYLTGKERPIRFNVSNMNEEAEIVQALSKWEVRSKRGYPCMVPPASKCIRAYLDGDKSKQGFFIETA